MKIVHVNEHLARKGGVETYLLALLPMLAERGVEAHVLYGAGDPAQHAATTCVPGVGQTGFRGENDVQRQVMDVLEREQPDVIHVHNVQNLGALQACLSYGPTVMTAHDYRAVCPANMFFYKRTQEVCGRAGAGPGCFATTLRKHCLTPRPQYAAYFYHRTRWTTDHAARFARVIAPSSGARERLVRAGFDAAGVTVLPYFCPVEPALQPRPLPVSPTITFMGRIAPNKGQEFFVEALGLLPSHVRGIMVGDLVGEKAEEVRRMAGVHGCADRLSLRPWASRAEVLEVFDDTTVFVFPSLWEETLGIVGLEALSRGVPVVASDLGGVREWLRHGVNGYLVPPKSGAHIRDAVMRLLDREATLMEFGQRGIETIRERFMPAHHADELVRLYGHVGKTN